jgi:hypothetical protein
MWACGDEQPLTFASPSVLLSAWGSHIPREAASGKSAPCPGFEGLGAVKVQREVGGSGS